MQIILKKDVPRVGQRYDVLEVKDGFGAHLINTGGAERATKGKLAHVKSMQAKRDAEEAANTEAVVEAIKAANGTEVSIEAVANEKGGLFEGVTTDAIATALQAAGFSAIGGGHIKLDAPLKEVGEHEVALVSGSDTGSVKVNIVGIAQ